MGNFRVQSKRWLIQKPRMIVKDICESSKSVWVTVIAAPAILKGNSTVSCYQVMLYGVRLPSLPLRSIEGSVEIEVSIY